MIIQVYRIDTHDIFEFCEDLFHFPFSSMYCDIYRTLQNEHPLVYSEIARKYCEDHAHRIVWKD
jgi:hypothetical protein